MTIAGNISSIRENLAVNAATIDGLRTHQSIPEQIAAPAFIVLGPREIEFDKTMARGTDRLVFDCLLVASRADARQAQRALDSFLNTKGAGSIKVALEDDRTLNGACEDLRVTRINDYGSVEIASVTYLAARIEVEIYVDNT